MVQQQAAAALSAKVVKGKDSLSNLAGAFQLLVMSLPGATKMVNMNADASVLDLRDVVLSVLGLPGACFFVAVGSG